MPEEKIIKVGGMHCATCASTVEKSLKKLDGTLDVVVNLSTEEAHIIYEPRKVSIDKIKTTIENAGYEYLGIADTNTNEITEKIKIRDLNQLKLRFIIGFIFSIPLMVIMYIPLHHSHFPIHLVLFLISTPVFIYLSAPIFKAGFKAVKNKKLNMDVMYSVGIGVAFITSLMATFNIILSQEFMFYETTIFLATFLTLGRYLEMKAKQRTSDAIRKLMGLQPKTALVIRNGNEIEIPIQEKNSIHPLAEAIVEKALSNGIELIDCKEFETIEGKGVKATINNEQVFIGNKNFLLESGVLLNSEQEFQIAQIEKQGASVVLVAQNNTLIGIIGIADTLKSTTKLGIEEIKKLKINPVMITGDNWDSAKKVGQAIGIEKIIANVHPQDKSEEVKKLQKNGEIVAFVGDGINDAPALAQADLGIAIGTGTDIAIETGDIVLMKGEIIDAVSAIQLGRKVMSRIRQNLFWAFFYNIILIPVAAGLLYPLFKIGLKPEFAGLTMAMSSVTVVSLSLMLKKYIPPVKNSSHLSSK